MSDCAICLECISETIDIKLTECNHTFHTNCFETWVKINNSCPLCRKVFQIINNVVNTNIPLSFWFSQNTGLAIPLVSIPFAVIDYNFQAEESQPSGGRGNHSRIDDTRFMPFALHPESNEPSGFVNFNRINIR